ncbi:hypothetical protein LCGC14_0623100 [marine sediment metagenome]|uniref:Uncharacterized protein n=1 Tax=marine sediment metagenome TaxID=412755 RepID=A0A0F9UCT3_9ZZZZ
MAYSAYERVAGSSVIEAVEAHCRHLTASGTFGANSTPSLARVEQWIDQTYFDIQMRLAQEGYSTTVPSTSTAALGFLERLNVFGAVVQVELAHPITGLRGEPNDRYKQYAAMYKEGISVLATDALSVMGVERETQLSAYLEVGGISRSGKDRTYTDTDAVQSRFRRGFGRNPLAGTPISEGGTPV